MASFARRLRSARSAVATAVRNPALAWRRLAQLREVRALGADLDRLAAWHRGAPHDFRGVREERLARILAYARRHTRYYREVFARAGVGDHAVAQLEALPLLDKATIRLRRAELTPDCIESVPHFTMNTGGSTGEPLEFPVWGGVDVAHQRFMHAGIVRCDPSDVIVACDGVQVPEPLRARGVYWVPKASKGYGDVSFSSHDLSGATAPHYVRRLLELRPAVVRGYPSAIHELASHILSHGIALGFRVKGVILTAENAYDHQRVTIRRAFGAPVFLQYGHSEASVYGYTLPDETTYFCSPFYGLAEVVDPGGRHVAVGEEGEVVVTGFHSWPLPFIRYRTGDVAVYGGETDGVVKLAALVGRTQDVVYAADGRRSWLTALVFGCHYHAFANIRRWQIVQEHPGAVTILVVRAPGYGQADEDEIRSTFSRIAGVETRFEYVDATPLTPRGKSRLLVQRCVP